MKRFLLPIMAVLAMGTASAQNTAWGTTAGYLTGIGTTSAQFPLHLHGTTNFVEGNTNYGVSSWIGFTNTTTGAANTDGLLMRLSGTAFTIDNREDGNISLTSGTGFMTLLGSVGRFGVGSTSISSSTSYGAFNIMHSTDNGLFIRTYASGKFGLSIRTAYTADNAIQVISALTTQNAFTVNNNGKVRIYSYGMAPTDEVLLIENGTQRLLQLENSGLLYAREIKVNANAWADFVFEPGYVLRPLEDVETCIREEGHLPDMPCTAEVMRDGINVAEMNTLLLQKVEELTLYMIELQKKNKELELRMGELDGQTGNR